MYGSEIVHNSMVPISSMGSIPNVKKQLTSYCAMYMSLRHFHSFFFFLQENKCLCVFYNIPPPLLQFCMT